MAIGMAGGSTVKLDTRVLDKIAATLDINTERVGVRFAFQLEAMAKQAAPYETGALSASIAVVTKDDDGNGSAQSAALANNKKVLLVRVPTPEGKIFANVGPVVEYGLYQEFGTSKMAAQPYLLPSVERIYKRYQSGKEWRSIVATRG